MAFHDKRLKPFAFLLASVRNAKYQDPDLERQLAAEEDRLLATGIERKQIDAVRRDKFCRFPK